MSNIKIRYSVTDNVEDIPGIVADRIEKVTADPGLDAIFSTLRGAVRWCKKESIDSAIDELSYVQAIVQDAYTTLEEARTIMQAYKQALTGDYEAAEESPPPKPDPLAMVEGLKNLADSMKSRHGES